MAALREIEHLLAELTPADVLTILESGKAGQAISDDKVLTFAVEAGRILVTMHRKHFIRLHNLKPEHAGIIVCTVDPDFEALAERIHAELEAQPSMSSQPIRINRPNR